jgi:hypothetical protein
MQSGRAKDPLWWVHPDFRDGVIELDGILEFPAGSIQLINPENPEYGEPIAVTIEHGEFSSLASILFMINGHRPGPIRGFYVVVEAKKGKAWCVGQIHADSVTPLRVFANCLYDSEELARNAAEKLRLADIGNSRPRMN